MPETSESPATQQVRATIIVNYEAPTNLTAEQLQAEIHNEACGLCDNDSGSKLSTMDMTIERIEEEAEIYGNNDAAEDKSELEAKADLYINGPWNITEDSPNVYDQQGNEVCQVFPAIDTLSDDNGLSERLALIHSAPQLLAALKRADALLTDLRAYDLDGAEDIETLKMIDDAFFQADIAGRAVQS